MQLLDLTLPSAAENLALDEALLDAAEAAAERSGEVLRIWEPQSAAVVLGRSSRIDREVNREACRTAGVPLLRRTSGGLTVLVGPGCLMYALVLRRQGRPELCSSSEAHRFVLCTLAAALAPHVPGVRCQGTSDLAIGERKFSGNSIRARRTHLLYHGTLLYGFRLQLIERCLRVPPRMPGYRQRRPHATFVANLPLSGEAIRRALIAAWDAVEPLGEWPRERTRLLAAERYESAAWTEEGRWEKR
jgi:lipoate-protein ligase A